jgi:hypothetical protein
MSASNPLNPLIVQGDHTVEQDFAMNRQLFLCEQGYEYHIVTLDCLRSLLPPAPAPREP